MRTTGRIKGCSRLETATWPTRPGASLSPPISGRSEHAHMRTTGRITGCSILDIATWPTGQALAYGQGLTFAVQLV